jgi:DNA-binding response OmpR family regulator
VSSSRKLALVAQPAAPGRVRFPPFELDLGTGEALREQRGRSPAAAAGPRSRAPRPAPGRLVTREDLRRHLWGDDVFVDFQRGLNFCIMQIRDALGDDAETPRFVETLPRRGYASLPPPRPRPAGPRARGPHADGPRPRGAGARCTPP